MPNLLYGLDASFPQFGRNASQEQKISMIYDYLIQVQESLRYTLSNLGGDNFNDTELMLLGQTIREPVTLELQGLEGELMYLQTDQEGLSSRMRDAEGNIARFELTAQGLSGRLEDAEGNITSLQMSANELENRMKDAEGNVSALQQWADGFAFSVTDGEKSTKLELKSGETTLASAQINLTGMVTFADLKNEGTTEINGSNIKTGKISAIEIEGCTWRSTNDGGYGIRIQQDRQHFMMADTVYAEFFLNTDGWFDVSTYGNYSMNIGSNKKLKLLAGTGMSLDAVETIYIGASGGYATTVGIGNKDATVYLDGTVYLNGVPLTAG